MHTYYEFQEPPFVFKSKTLPEKEEHFDHYYNDTTGFYYYGYCIDLIMRISKEMTFNFTLIEPPDYTYGTMKEDGSWDGMVKELMEEVCMSNRHLISVLLVDYRPMYSCSTFNMFLFVHCRELT